MNPTISIFVLFVLLASAMGRPNKEEWEAMKQKCIESTSVKPELLKGPRGEGPVDETVKCFFACVMKEKKVLKEDGSFDVDMAISHVPEDAPEREKIIAAITECGAKKGDNDCETAHQIHTCMHEKKLPHMGHHRHE